MEPDERETIAENLSEYLYIERFFGDIVRRRLALPTYRRGTLTSHLLDKRSEPALEALEQELDFGYLNCGGYERIFSGEDLSPYSDLDMRMRDMLARVKGFEILARSRFTHITVPKHGDVSVVDFTAQRNGRDYAIVVGLGVDEAAHEGSTQGGTVASDTEQQPSRAIAEGISAQYPRLSHFCQQSAGEWQGVMVISSGFDYLSSPPRGNWASGLASREAISLLRRRWTALTEHGREEYRHLSHIVLVDKRSHWHVYPSFEAFRR